MNERLVLKHSVKRGSLKAALLDQMLTLHRPPRAAIKSLTMLRHSQDRKPIRPMRCGPGLTVVDWWQQKEENCVALSSVDADEIYWKSKPPSGGYNRSPLSSDCRRGQQLQMSSQANEFQSHILESNKGRTASRPVSVGRKEDTLRRYL
jgi:hypothetical protein